MLFYKVIVGNSASVPAIKTDSVDLTVTSPPYLQAKNYDIDNAENVGNYPLREQLEMCKPIYKEVFRVLKPGRKFVVNVPDMIGKSPIDNKYCSIPLADETRRLLDDIGFIYEIPFMWLKKHSRTSNVGGSFPYPGGPVLTHDFEPCYIMRKPGDTDYSHVTKEQREASKMSPQFMADAMYNTIEIMGETQIKFHPAAFPEELVERFIALYTFVGETVYDPFLGSGTTLLAAKRLERSGIGTEIGYKTPDGVSWLEHVKNRIGWKDGNLHGDQILYEVLDCEGKVINSETVVGRGKLTKNVLNEAEIIGKPLTKFESDEQDEQETIVVKEPKEEKKQMRLF
jgi:DNA modification methylase